MDAIAPFFVGYADHRGVDHAIDGQQHIFHFARVNVVTAADQHIVLAIDNVEKSVRVHSADVAGMQPTVTHRFRGFFRSLPIVRHQLQAAANDFARLTDGDFVVIIVNDFRLDEGIGTSARADAVMFVGLQAGDHHGGFRLAVGLGKYRAERRDAAL